MGTLVTTVLSTELGENAVAEARKYAQTWLGRANPDAANVNNFDFDSHFGSFL
jgi:hypothetical protein